MQTSGEIRREIAASYSTVIARESGRSSIPETAVIEPISRGVLDTPLSRCMTGYSAASFFIAALIDAAASS